MPTDEPTPDTATEPSAARPAAPAPRRRPPPFVWVGAVGIVLIAALVAREVASIRAGEREIDRQMAELDRLDAQPAPYPDATARAGEEVVVRLTEVQRQGPGVEGRYQLDVATTRWALDLPASDADAATWTAWEASSRPRWEALARSLHELAEGGAAVRAEVFAPWKDAPDAVPERLVLRLLPVLASAGVLAVDLEHAPPSLRDDG